MNGAATFIHTDINNAFSLMYFNQAWRAASKTMVFMTFIVLLILFLRCFFSQRLDLLLFLLFEINFFTK